MKSKGVTRDDVLEVLYEPTAHGQRIIGFAVGDVKLSDGDVNQLVSEAKMFKQSFLWKLLDKRTCYAAQVYGVNKAKDFGDTRHAQGMIGAIEIQDEIVSILARYK